MSLVYRKSLKGIDELASKSGKIPLRVMSYLLAVDGVSSLDELAENNPHLPSMDVILNGLMQQGFIEVVSSGQALGGSAAAAVTAARQPRPFSASSAMSTQRDSGRDLETLKAAMVRDVSALLGSDAGPVLDKLQNCRNREDLFVAMMGIKKIVTIYVDKAAGDQFATRYETSLS